MVIAKTASKNVVAKADKMSEAVLDAQASFVTRDTNLGDAALVASDRANLEDI